MADAVNDLIEVPAGPELMQDGTERSEEEEPQAPYFFYRDHSHLPDPDPSKPVTVPGRIPTFPAKLFAILSRPELADIISWMPHGRSWKVHKPREFEVKVIPSYFDHAKFSSFIRQANGWGFKRVCTKGVDRNSHYHELFLRGMPHLIKFMKRPVSGAKIPSQPLHLKGKNCDPDFYRISQEHPLPEFTPKMMHPLDESNFLNSGANNRMLGSANERPSQPTPGFSQAQNTSTSGQQGEQQQLAQQLQTFFTSDDSLFLDMSSIAEQPTSYTPANQAFLLPRVVESSASEQNNHMVPLPPITSSNMCPVRQEEKDLDPLTILLNDVFDEETHIDDPIIQSLLSAPTVPPPSSLNMQHGTPLSHPSTPPMESREVISHHTLYHAPLAPAIVQVVSPVEEKHVMELPEPAYVHFGQFSHPMNDEMSFFDPFSGGLVAQDFW